MNLNSKYFDMIRASRHQGREEKRAQMVERRVALRLARLSESR